MIDVLGDGISFVTLHDYMGDDNRVVEAARVSYDADEAGEPYKNAAGLIRYMANHNHGTPFEHNALTFIVKCPFFVRAQWHRHRIGWSYNEISRRYTSENIEFYIPEEWHKQDKKNKQQSADLLSNPYLYTEYYKVIEQSMDTYERLLKQGVSREEARLVLPQSTYTRFYATCNLRSLVHFIRERSSLDAQRHIRKYSDAMWDMARDIFPLSVDALLGETDALGERA